VAPKNNLRNFSERVYWGFNIILYKNKWRKEGRRGKTKREEGRGKREEGRGKREEGRGKRERGGKSTPKLPASSSSSSSSCA
jgi:hypothetical protein